MSRSTSPSTDQTYGLVLVCRARGLPRSTHYARKVVTEGTPGRRGPVGFHSDEELLGHIVTYIQDSPFTGEGYRKVWTKLRFQGIRTSPLRVLRLMRDNSLLAVRNPGRPHCPKAHDGAIKTDRVDKMWGTTWPRR